MFLILPHLKLGFRITWNSALYLGSTFAVASSIINIRFFLRIALARHTSCLCPTLKFDPDSANSVSILPGRSSMASLSCTYVCRKKIFIFPPKQTTTAVDKLPTHQSFEILGTYVFSVDGHTPGRVTSSQCSRRRMVESIQDRNIDLRAET